jgi:hypothetical protein
LAAASRADSAGERGAKYKRVVATDATAVALVSSGISGSSSRVSMKHWKKSSQWVWD